VGPGDPIPLTEREVQILQLVVRGYANREIGARLGVGSATIRNRLSGIYVKLGVATRTHAAVRAIELGLCSAGPAADV
jgi:DNA-binding NarL/FixJ family response regulator